MGISTGFRSCGCLRFLGPTTAISLPCYHDIIVIVVRKLRPGLAQVSA
jgi:hypothetical protein